MNKYCLHELLLAMVILFPVGCGEKNELYHVNTVQWEGGEILEYFEFIDDSRSLYTPNVIKQTLVTWDQSFEFYDVTISGAFLDHGRVYLIVDNHFSRYLTILLASGRLEYICEINELRYNIIDELAVIKNDKKLLIEFKINNETTTKETKCLEENRNIYYSY